MLNTSDQNEIKSDISSELASFDEMMTCNLRYHIYLRMSLHQKLREVKILNIILSIPLKTKRILTNFGRKTSMENFLITILKELPRLDLKTFSGASFILNLVSLNVECKLKSASQDMMILQPFIFPMLHMNKYIWGPKKT